MMQHAMILLLLLLFLAGGLASTRVAAMDASRVAFRGFGTVGVACFTADDSDFSYVERPDGPGASRQCDAKLDTTLGLQLDAALTDHLDATLQATSYHRADGSFTPELTQANLRWTLDENASVRLGRMQSPVSLVAEYRNVLYAQPWVRSPMEVYNVATAYSMDALEYQHAFAQGERTWTTVQGGLARSEFDVSRRNDNGDTDTAQVDFAYLNLQLDQGPWSVKAGVIGGEVTYLEPNLETANAGGAFSSQPGLYDDLVLDGKRIWIATVGARYETDKWLLQGEYIYRTMDGFFRDQHGAYLLAGRRFGPWMPYGIVARRWSEPPGIETGGNPVADQIIAATNIDRASLALGLSRRLGEKAVVKFQVDWIDPEEGSSQFQDDEFLTTLNLDFVF